MKKYLIIYAIYSAVFATLLYVGNPDMPFGQRIGLGFVFGIFAGLLNDISMAVRERHKRECGRGCGHTARPTEKTAAPDGDDEEGKMSEAHCAAMKDLAWEIHVMISHGKTKEEIDKYVTDICDF